PLTSIKTSDGTKEPDMYLPIANVSRIMKKSLPANAKISKEAKETVQECVSEFISFVTGEASEKCQREKRKTVNGDDLLWAMTTLGFQNYVGILKAYLAKNDIVLARNIDEDDGPSSSPHINDDGAKINTNYLHGFNGGVEW
ncbi:hypothetical protein MIMGU_mgv1a026740mg, partial [Erythranthe guttata]